MIIETEFLATDSKLADLGLNSTDIFLKCAIDTEKIELIRQVCKSEDDEVDQEICAVWFPTEILKIKIPYEKAVELWKQSKGKIQSSKIDYLIDFLHELKDKGYINDYDFDYEAVSRKYVKSKSGTQ